MENADPRPALVFSPHPILLAKEQELVYAAFLPNETLLEYLRRTGLLERMGRQPFVLTVDGRRLPRTLWAHCRPKPGTLVNLYAVVHGGDGKKNPIAAIAMIALTVYAPGIAAGIGGSVGVTSAAGLAFIQVGVLVVGGMVINSIFPPPRPDLARAQNLGGGDSPTYAIGGGSNRMRRYEPMPKICGVHRVFPDFGAQPYNEFEGNEQVGYYVFDFGYNDADLSDFKIGDTPIEDFEGVELEISGADGKLALFPGNVDSIAGVELTEALGFVQRTSSPEARSLAVELTGALFFLGDTGTEPRQASVDIEYRLSGAGAWTALQFSSDATPATSIVEGVARVPASQYTHGVRKQITGQPKDQASDDPIWGSWLTVLSASVNVAAGDYLLVLGKSGMRWQQRSGGPALATGAFLSTSTLSAGGMFLLYNGDRTQSVLVQVAPFNPGGFFPIGEDSTVAYIAVGANQIAGQFMLVNATREPLRRTFKWHVAEGQYEVRVKKSTPDEVSLRATAQIVWSQLRTYQPDDADYTGRLRVGLKVRASALASGVLQQLSCIARARARAYVPLNTITAGYESSSWAVGVTPTGYALNQSQAGESVFAARVGPFGTTEVVNVCVNKDVFAGEPGADGGWNTNVAIAVDGTKSHLFAVFMKRKVTGGIGYWGMLSNGATHAVVVAGGVGDNPYFAFNAPANLMPNNDAWYLVVGFMHANGYAGGDLGISGVYNSAGTRVYDGIEFAWAANTTLAAHRSYHHYNSTDPVDTECQQMTRPVIVPCTAAEAPGVISAILAQSEIATAPEWPIRHTSNPAWWYLDALRGKTINGRRVYGAGLADSRIDIDGLKAFAAWCDAEGLTFNGVFDQQQSLFEVLSAIALMGRATPTMQTGKHGVLWDAPGLPVTALFGMHNIMPGSFEIDYASGDLADVIEGWFINVELGWQRDFVRALVPGATSQARVRRVELFGCTNKAQAGQAVNLYAAANFYRPRRYKWRSDWEQMPCPRGDVAELGHDLLQLLSGRFIEGGNATTLKLPRLVPLYATGGFVTIVEPDGEFDTYPVDAGVGETDTLTLPAPLAFNPWADPTHPPYDYRWHYGPVSTTGRKVKIESFKPVSERYVDVSAVDEDSAYYAAKDNALVALPPPHLFGQVQLQAVNVTEDGVRAGTGYLARVLVSWDVTGDYGFADVRASVAGGPVELLQAGVRGRSHAFNVQDFTDVVVEVTAWSSFGRHGKSSKLTVEHHVNYAGQSAPSDVRGFLLDGNKFRWSAAPEVDVVGYRIRYHFGENLAVVDAHELHQGLLSSSPAQFDVLPAGVVTFFLTAVDAAGLESVAPATIIKDLGDPELANVVEEKDFKAESWPGTLSGGTEVRGDLEANATTAFYGADNAAFYGADAAPFYEDEVYTEMIYDSVGFYFSNDWIGSEMTLKHTLEGDGLNIEYRQSNDEPFYGADADPFYGADADLFYGEVGDFRAWPGTVTFRGGDYQLRVTTGAGPIQGAVRELRVVIDVPDVVEDLNDIQIPQGGARLPITKDFDAIKTVQLTLQVSAGTAVSTRILDKDPALGPLVECIDETQASVAGLIDATITGR